jgi:molybdopterin molybdotransferase
MPNYFGVWRGDSGKARSGGKAAAPRTCLLFGVPGNPVSALLSYHQFVRPALLKMSGQRTPGAPLLMATLEKDLKKKAGRRELVRGVLRVENGRLSVIPADLQGSHMLSGLAAANCVIHLAADATAASRGEEVPVEILSWEGHF